MVLMASRMAPQPGLRTCGPFRPNRHAPETGTKINLASLRFPQPKETNSGLQTEAKNLVRKQIFGVFCVAHI